MIFYNKLNIFFLLLLTRAFIPADVQAVITGLDIASNFYKYFPFERIRIYELLINKFEFELSNSSLKSLGLNYSSTVANIFPTLTWTFFMIIFSVLLYFIRLLLSWFRENRRWLCIMKTQYWIVDRLFKIMILCYFIRSTLEISQLILISSINEIWDNNTSNFYRALSFAFSILMILIYMIITGLILYLIFTSYRINENEHNKLEEFFRGLQQDKKHRIYVTILLLRRIIFVSLLTTLISVPSRILIVVLVIIQTIYLIYLSYLRPYEGAKGNFIDILNEIYFGALLIFLATWNTENEWNSLKIKIWMWIIASNNFAVLMNYIINFFWRRYHPKFKIFNSVYDCYASNAAFSSFSSCSKSISSNCGFRPGPILSRFRRA